MEPKYSIQKMQQTEAAQRAVRSKEVADAARGDNIRRWMEEGLDQVKRECIRRRSGVRRIGKSRPLALDHFGY